MNKNIIQNIFPLFLLIICLAFAITGTHVSNASFIENIDPMLEIARGDVPGVSHVNKFGMNEDIDVAARETVWEGGGNYIFLSVPETIDVASTDTDDDGSPAGTGAHTMELIGLDTNWDALTETVTLNGTTTVTTSASFLRLFRMVIRSAGSSGGNEGLITAFSTDTTTLQAVIPNSGDLHNQTEMAVFSVPRNKTGFITHYYGSMNAESPGAASDPAADLELAVCPFGEVFQIKHEVGLVREGSSQLQHLFIPYLVIEEKSDIQVLAHVTDDDTAISAGFDIILVDN